MANERAIRRWEQKLAKLQEAEAIATNADEKYQLEVQISEAKAKIEELTDEAARHIPHAAARRP